MPDGRRMGAFPTKPATLLNYMIIKDLTVGHASFLQNNLGGERPVSCQSENSCRYWPRRFHQVFVRARDSNS